jgi:hypothetical protein
LIAMFRVLNAGQNIVSLTGKQFSV